MLMLTDDEPLRKIAHEVMIEEGSPSKGDDESQQTTCHSDIVVNGRQLDTGLHLTVSIRYQLLGSNTRLILFVNY
jgi:hypothetical protein